MGEPARPSIPPEETLVHRDPALDWMTAHPEELARYRGCRIAIDPTRGILASASTPEALLAELDRLGVPADDRVLLAVAPAW